jgi:predicted metal-dependent peptidase
MLTTAQVDLGAATFLLSVQRPYLATALWAVQRVPQAGLGTLAVDRRWRLYYDPQAVAAWSVEELAGVLYHEICHLLRAHADRAAGMAADPRVWNLAADAEINDDLQRESGVALPAGPVTPETLGQPIGLLAEEYYAALVGNRRVAVDDGSPIEVRVVAGRCGSGAGGEALALVERAPLATGLIPEEIAVVRRCVAQAIREKQRGRGSLPGHWSDWAELVLEPRVDWRRKLAAVVRRALGDAAGAVDYSYSRPSRRQACFGSIVAPALRQPTPAVVVVVDTSGSMMDLLGLALAEVGGILRACGVKDGVRVLSVDAAVHASQRVWRPEQVELLGGGGTDLRVGLAAAQRSRPDVVVVLTDGYTPWPRHAPNHCRVIIADLVGNTELPEWAEVIHVK